jgi:hypothetical protein
MRSTDDTIKGIFLLILAVSGNFVAETMGCKTQKLLSESMLAKHSIIYLIIYFALGFTTDETPHPIDLAKNALVIWILFLLFTKMSLPFTILVFALLSIRYILNTYIEYLKSDGDEKNRDLIKNTKLIGKNITYLVTGLVIIGFSLYFRNQYNEYYKTWSTFKFIFGVNKCKSLS